jgi:transposase
MADPRHPKRAFLEAAGALHTHPEHVRAELFRRFRFFDPLDKVQVKYEMLRANALGDTSVSEASRVFGFSRQTFYTVLEAFEEWGVLGLTDGQRGRRGPVKLSAEDLAFVEATATDNPGLSGRVVAERLLAERGVTVHRRTIERLIARGGKKNG